MEAAGLVLSAAQNIFAALQCKELKQICSLWGYESELEKLQNTVDAIKSVLLDAEAQQLLSHQQVNYVHKLKDVVYKADDLLDHFTVVSEKQHQLHQYLLERGKVPKKLWLFFSRFGELGVTRKMSKNVKKIRQELDGIATDAGKLCFKINNEPIKLRREDTCSYVKEKNILGREKETGVIVNMLLSPSDSDVVAIVGMGGMGKTTLARLVYRHDKIINEFDLRLWVCVSDQDQKTLPLQPILAKILESATEKKQDGSGIELVQRQLEKRLQRKKYLLVLDDVWTEDHNSWLELQDLLVGGEKGSRVLVTTRSKRTAQIVGSSTSYELHGLSKEHSWLLFQKIAFEEQGQRECNELEDIGKHIVKQCSNVPLSIRVVGSLLYRQGKQKWQDFQQHGLAMLKHHDNPITQILKLSYLHLHSSLKSCFSYCAIFPKDFVIRKQTLISLWMAQGYVEPSFDNQSIEDACEESFLILVRRCFFQDVEKDEFGEIVSCKMHDLFHDMALEVAGKEIGIVESPTSSLDKRIHHVSVAEYDCTESHFSKLGIRTYLSFNPMVRRFPVKTLLAKWECLRVLDLHGYDDQCLPEAIGHLVHLRYLDVSCCERLKKLPESITRLHYLQTLKMRGCKEVKELPKKFSNLVKLRLLDVECSGLTCMPSGMAKLTCLRWLDMFLVSERNSGSQQQGGNLEDPIALNDLKGRLLVRIKQKYRYIQEGSREGGYLRNKEYLNDIRIEYEGRADGEEALLEDLQPHHNIKGLSLSGYYGGVIPSWATEENIKACLPNLVKISLEKCKGLQELPSLSGLQHLKIIQLCELNNLKYMEKKCDPRSAVAPFFPSLKTLQLKSLRNLRGWSGRFKAGEVSFPCLSELKIVDCPSLISIPLCPTVEKLDLWDVNEKLRNMMEAKEARRALAPYVDTSASSLPLPWSLQANSKKERHPNLRRVHINKAAYLKCLPVTALACLTEMIIRDDHAIERLSEVREVLHSCSSSLRSLELKDLPKLRSLSGGGLEYLIGLETLTLSSLPSLSLVDEKGQDEEGDKGMPWRYLHQTLRFLQLHRLPKVVNLPNGMQQLTSLQYLYIYHVNLEALPEWIGCLSSLRLLHIQGCRGIESLPGSMQQLTSLTNFIIWRCSERLHHRCQSADGDDWPIIQHISYIDNDIRNDTYMY